MKLITGQRIFLKALYLLAISHFIILLGCTSTTNDQNPSQEMSRNTVDISIPLVIEESLGIDRENEMVHNGIPLSREDNITSVQELYIEDSNGSKVPATFEILSRWAGGKDDASKAVQWLLVSFPVSISANETHNFYLKQGTPAEISTRVVYSESEDSFSVDTGKGVFVIEKNAMTLFKSLSLNGSAVLSGTGASNSTINGQGSASAETPVFTIERSNDHYLCIKAEGDYGNTPVGPRSARPLSYKIRYEFFADSPTVIIYHKFFWAGYDGGSRGRPSGDYYITVDNVSLTLPSMSGYTSTDVYADPSTYQSGALSAGESASVAQRLRTLFDNPNIAEVNHGSTQTTTDFATRPMLINRSAGGSVAVSIDHMKYFEPQSIETDSSGTITVNVMAENQDFANLQGTWARAGISVLPASATYDETVSKNFAPLNARLFVFPTPEYVRETEVFSELVSDPANSENSIIREYFDKLKAVTQTTRTFLEEEKFHGLMTWGSMTGYSSLLGDQPGWDKIFEGAWNTDYHNAWNNVVKTFALEGDASHLYDLSFMGARRMLHTQIIQPDWDASTDYMGWGYAGYGRFRSDPNSSHSYFENLISYYYLTGDMEVIDILKVGANNKREDYTRDDEGNLNDMLTGGVDWVDRVDRRGMQAAKMFSFIGHTDDETYLEDYRHIFEQAFSRSLALLRDNGGNEYGFLSTNQDTSSGFPTEQIWMLSLYFFDYLYDYYNEFGDVELGVDDVLISRVFAGCANAYMAYSNPANNAWNQDWYNQFVVNYTGGRIGGLITSIEGGQTSGNPSVMYNSGKFPVIALFFRAGMMSGNTSFDNYGVSGINWATGYEEYVEAEEIPWAKINAALFNRLHHALSYLD